MYLTDLSSIEEGTPNFIEEHLVNVSKMRMVSAIGPDSPKYVSACTFYVSKLTLTAMMSQMSSVSLLFFIFDFSVICLNEDCTRHYQQIDSPGQELFSARSGHITPRKYVDSFPREFNVHQFTTSFKY